MNRTLTPKERLALQRVAMPELPAEERSRNFEEVNLGLSGDQALTEARRCLQCRNRPCVAGCPVGVSIPEFLDALACDDLPRSVQILRGDNALPAVTGRVCPQESQCEATCVVGAKYKPVSIGRLERFVATYVEA